MNRAIFIILALTFGATARKAHATPFVVKDWGAGNVPGQVAQTTIEISGNSGICSAVLVGFHSALTAAHCVLKDRELVLNFPKSFWTDGTKITVDKILLPPDLDLAKLNRLPRETNLNDLALVHFSGALPYGFHPAELNFDPSYVISGTELVIAGFGVTDPALPESSGILRAKSVKVLDARYAGTEIKLDASQGGSCFGDSGGPAFLSRFDHYYLVGIDNWGQGACNEFSIYALVQPHMNWIRSVLWQFGDK